MDPPSRPHFVTSQGWTLKALNRQNQNVISFTPTEHETDGALLRGHTGPDQVDRAAASHPSGRNHHRKRPVLFSIRARSGCSATPKRLTTAKVTVAPIAQAMASSSDPVTIAAAALNLIFRRREAIESNPTFLPCRPDDRNLIEPRLGEQTDPGLVNAASR